MSVQSLIRAFAILNAVADSPDAIGVTAIARQVNLHKATVSRLVATLEEIGAVKRLPNNEGFQIGDQIMALASQANPHQQLIALARPAIEELADVTQEAVSLEVPDGRFILYLDQVQTAYHIRVNSWIGRRYPMHTITSGALFMAGWSAKALDRYFNDPLERFASRTVIDLPAMRRKIAAAEAAGFALAVDEFEDGLTGLSAPIVDPDGCIIAAINICGPSFRFPTGRQLELVITRLKEAVGQVSARMTDFELRVAPHQTEPPARSPSEGDLPWAADLPPGK